jgi:hypothetical protein
VSVLATCTSAAGGSNSDDDSMMTSNPNSTTAYSAANAASNGTMPCPWTLAGMSDGSVAVYDERMSSHGGFTHRSRDHTSWVISAHIRMETLQVCVFVCDLLCCVSSLSFPFLCFAIVS